MSFSKTTDLVYTLQELLKSTSDASLSKASRKQACELARKLWVELEEPGDMVDRYVYMPQEFSIIPLALDLGIFDYLIQHNGDTSSNDLAIATKVDSVLMARILRNLAALGQIEETDVDSFQANKVTRALTSDKSVNGFKYCFDCVSPAWMAMPAFLKSINYQNPTDPVNTPLQLAHNSKNHFFQILSDLGVLEAFQVFMSTYRTDRPEFLDVFPADERLLHGSEDDGILLIDIGGGRGHDIQKFIEKFPQAKDRTVLQEVEDVAKQALEIDGMQVMVHDFFTPQPVKGARAYYFRMILHDWPDEQCVSILKNVALAMKSGYSKVLINDVVLPDKGASRLATQSDIAMLALLAGMERSEAQWRQLLDRAGLRLIKVWWSSPESVVEAELAG